MLDRLKKLAALCLGLSVVVLFARLVWIASHAETGWETCSIEIRNSTVGIFNGPRNPFDEVPSDDPSEFFLTEVDRLVSKYPESAEASMGGALILDSVPPWPNSVDRDPNRLVANYLQMRSSEARYESQCRERCLELAARSTQLEPNNPLWWRLRAVLLLNPNPFTDDGLARDPNWRSILDECAERDPDNGLYDLIAAHLYLGQSVKYKSRERYKGEYVIHDPVGWKKANQHLIQVLRKPRLELGYDYYPVLFEQLEKIQVRRTDHDSILYTRRINERIMDVVMQLSRILDGMAETDHREGRFPSSIHIHRLKIELMRRLQFRDSEGPCWISMLEIEKSGATIRHLVSRDSSLISQDELDEIKSIERQARIDRRILFDYSASNGPQDRMHVDGMSFTLGQNPLKSIRTLARRELPCIIALLLATAFLFRVTVCQVPDEIKSPGTLTAIVLFLISVGAIVGLICIGPADLIVDSARNKIVLMIPLIVPVVLLGWLIVKVLRRTKGKISLRAYLAIFLLLSVVSGMGLRAFSLVGGMRNLPNLDLIPTRGMRNLSADEMQSAAHGKDAFVWVLLQWHAYHAFAITILTWVLLFATWHVICRFRARKNEAVTRLSKSRRIRSYIPYLGSPCAILGCVALSLYLIILSSAVGVVEKRYQEDMKFARDPAKALAEYQTDIKESPPDQRTMRFIEATVDAEMQMEFE